jgi:hypothetical protein
MQANNYDQAGAAFTTGGVYVALYHRSSVVPFAALLQA